MRAGVAALAIALSGCAAPPAHQPEPTISTPTTLSGSISLCKAVQAKEDIPITCGFDYVGDGGIPTMLIGFPSIAVMNDYLDAVNTIIGGPYCDNANRGSRPAALVFYIKDMDRARAYSCETDEFGDWFGLKEPASDAPTERAPQTVDF